MASSATDHEKGTEIINNRLASSDDAHHHQGKFESAHDAATSGHAATDAYVALAMIDLCRCAVDC
jgi:hypothetical protein